jgi:hypothetical protein
MNSAGLKPTQYGPLTGETRARVRPRDGFAQRPPVFRITGKEVVTLFPCFSDNHTLTPRLLFLRKIKSPTVNGDVRALASLHRPQHPTIHALSWSTPNSTPSNPNPSLN